MKNTFPHKVYKGAPPCLGAPKGVRMKKGKKMIAHSDNMSLLDIDVNKKGFMHAKARTCLVVFKRSSARAMSSLASSLGKRAIC